MIIAILSAKSNLNSLEKKVSFRQKYTQKLYQKCIETCESNESDSEFYTLDPYSCIECGKKLDEWKDFREHLMQVHKIPI